MCGIKFFLKKGFMLYSQRCWFMFALWEIKWSYYINLGNIIETMKCLG